MVDETYTHVLIEVLNGPNAGERTVQRIPPGWDRYASGQVQQGSIVRAQIGPLRVYFARVEELLAQGDPRDPYLVRPASRQEAEPWLRSAVYEDHNT